MTKPRTSLSHPLEIAEVRASAAHGRIGITFCPGKHDSAALTGAWARDLATDLDAVAAWGARLVLTLTEQSELVALRVSDLGAEVLRRGIDWRHLPIADYGTPDDAFEWRWRSQGADIRGLLRRGDDIVVHCKGGLGRAGMIAARLLAELGMAPEAAIKAVRGARKRAIETPSQHALVLRTKPIDDREWIDVATAKKVGGSLGANPGGVFMDENGRRYYVKTLESAAQAQNEFLAAKLYQLAGAPTLTYLRASDPTQVATEWVDLEKKSVARFSDDERRQARRWLGAHAWTANWDAIGLHGENQGVAAGQAITLDVGGALEFRGNGDPKGQAFGPCAREVETLRTNPDNPHAAKLFAGMSAFEVGEAIAAVTRIPDAAIRRTVAENGGSEALAEKLVARKADMAARVLAR